MSNYRDLSRFRFPRVGADIDRHIKQFCSIGYSAFRDKDTERYERLRWMSIRTIDGIGRMSIMYRNRKWNLLPSRVKITCVRYRIQTNDLFICFRIPNGGSTFTVYVSLNQPNKSNRSVLSTHVSVDQHGYVTYVFNLCVDHDYYL